MKKFTLFCGVLFVLAGCSNWGKADPASFSENAPSTLFQQLKITWHGAVSPESIAKEIVIENSKKIALNMKSYSESELKNECNGVGELIDEDYIKVLSLLDKAHLDVYFPGPDCEPLIGTAGVTIAYTLTDGTSKEYTTLCNVDQQIKELLDTVEYQAIENVTGCEGDDFEDEIEPPAQQEGFCGTSTSAYCASDAGCKIGGCANDVCEGATENTMTICMLRECTDAEKYGFSCGCVDGKCQWK